MMDASLLMCAQPVFSARRLLRPDMPQTLSLCHAVGADAAWAVAQPVPVLLAEAELWGGWAGETQVLCAALAPLQAPLPLCEAVRKTQVLQAPCTLLCIAACGADARQTEHFLQILLARQAQCAAAQAQNRLAVLLGVKSSAALACACFTAGLVLVALRPLYQLRPHYIFVPAQMQKYAKESIMVSFNDTLQLGRLLEDGWAVTALLPGGSAELQRMEPTHESRNT